MEIKLSFVAFAMAHKETKLRQNLIKWKAYDGGRVLGRLAMGRGTCRIDARVDGICLTLLLFLHRDMWRRGIHWPVCANECATSSLLFPSTLSASGGFHPDYKINVMDFFSGAMFSSFFACQSYVQPADVWNRMGSRSEWKLIRWWRHSFMSIWIIFGINGSSYGVPCTFKPELITNQ